jgi:hypothetical protein
MGAVGVAVQLWLMWLVWLVWLRSLRLVQALRF